MNEGFQIGHRRVGKNEPCFVIAEIGSNHNQKISQAKKLIDAACRAGCDAVKFQLFKADFLYTPENPLYLIFKQIEFPREWLSELFTYCKKKGILFLATPFDTPAVDLLDELGVKAFKIASSEAVNLPFLRHVASTQKPIILSTGMCNLADIYEAMEVIEQSGNRQVILLQCSALYPTDPAQVHLRTMDTLREVFKVPVGFSDHTLGILFPAVAVARGACVIEKHFTLDRKMSGPDHFYAIEPGELAQMVKDIRAVEQGLGSDVKKMLPEEKKLARRESVFAKRNIAKNAKISAEDMVIKRPAAGIDSRFLKAAVGAKAIKNIKAGDPIVWDILGGQSK